MKVDFSQVFTDLNGNPVKAADGQNLTLGTIACGVLDVGAGEPYEERCRRAKLAILITKYIQKDGLVDLKSDEVALIKKLIQIWTNSNLVAFQSEEMLEGKPAKEKSGEE